MGTVEQDMEALAQLFPRLIGAFQRQLGRDLAAFGLTLPQLLTLIALQRANGHCRMGPLAKAAYQSSASMTGIVGRLLERNLVVRERSEEDRRFVVVALTEQGRELLDQAKDIRRRRWRRFLEQVSPEDRQRILAMLHILVDDVEVE